MILMVSSLELSLRLLEMWAERYTVMGVSSVPLRTEISTTGGSTVGVPLDKNTWN